MVGSVSPWMRRRGESYAHGWQWGKRCEVAGHRGWTTAAVGVRATKQTQKVRADGNGTAVRSRRKADGLRRCKGLDK